MNTGDKEMEALVVAVDGDDEFQLCLGELVGRYLKKRERAIRDMEAARLLPLGAEVVAIRQGCHLSTAYRRASRAKVFARNIPDANQSA